MLDSFFNAIFGVIIEAWPLGGVLVVSFVLTLLVTIIYKYMTDQRRLKEMKDEMKDLRNQMKQHKGDQAKLMEIQKQSMQKSMEQMKHTFKPMLITFLPLIVIFSWLRNTYDPVGTLIGPLTWIWVYIISSIVFSFILRKVLKVH